MKSSPQRPHTLIVAVLASLAVIHLARAAESPFASTNIDSAFSAGLAKLKRATGFIEDQPGQSATDWKPGLQLLVGVKAVESSKRTIYFVELTTMDPPTTNSAGQPWRPLLRTNHWAWSRTNKARFITTNYPVRVRVFNETGRALKEGQTPMAWGMLTNGLLDLCRLSLETFGSQTNRPTSEGRKLAGQSGDGEKSTAPKPQDNDRLMRATGGGFLWMMGMFSDLQTVPTVADVWGKARCAFRWPSLWTLAKSVVSGFQIAMVPRPEQVTLARAGHVSQTAPLYCLPVDIMNEGRNLTRVQIIVGPAHGAEMLMAGIRTIHARHPAKPKQEFITQVLAAGRAREP
ncbi:MAG TPA: hypothetical protein VNT99_20745 [Methylomirabilota bacterium]|nr:hypothetical protein [Methylomirabilota bacterium]